MWDCHKGLCGEEWCEGGLESGLEGASAVCGGGERYGTSRLEEGCEVLLSSGERGGVRLCLDKFELGNCIW